MSIKKIVGFGAALLVVGSMSFVAFAQNNTAPATNPSPQLICEYAAPPANCDLVPGPNYNATTQCGLVLKCDTLGGPSVDILIPMPKSTTTGGSPTTTTDSNLTTTTGGTVNTSVGCPSGYLSSDDGMKCLKFDSYSVPTMLTNASLETKESTSLSTENGETDTKGSLTSQSVTSGGQTGLAPSDGKCPSGYALSNDGKSCVKPLIPTIFLTPSATTESFTFSAGPSGKIDVENSKTMEKTSIASTEGFKVVVGSEFPVTVQKGTDNVISISRNDISASVTTTGDVEVKEGKVMVAGQEMKIIPDAALSVARENLQATVKSIKLDEGSDNNVKYNVIATKDSKILGIFPVQVSITANVNAQTAAMENVRGPWWSFLAW